MLQVKNLSIYNRKDLHELVKDLSFSLRPAEKLAVIGEEGNGKSTLLRIICGIDVGSFIEWSGEINRDAMRLGYLEQELAADERAVAVCDYCANRAGFLTAPSGEISEIASKLGLKPGLFYDTRRMGELSGGESVKLRIALICLDHPDCYVLDEPGNDLDIPTLEWLENFIKTRAEPVIYVSHDETLLERTATAILHLEQLRRKTLPRSTLKRMGYREYVYERERDFAHQGQVAKKERAEERERLERFREIYEKVEHRQRTISRSDPAGGRLLKKKMKSLKSQESRYDREREDMTEFPESEEAISIGFPKVYLPAGKTVLDLSIASLKAGEKELAHDIKLFVRGGEHIGIIGPNGIGKTTLLRLISKDLLERDDISAAYMPQDYLEALDFSRTPLDYLCPSGKKEELTRARLILGSMKFTAAEAEHKISELSGGQKAKLFFAGMILSGANVLILDEPTRNFSPLSGPVIRGILKDFQGSIISVSHDRKYLAEVCGKIYELTPRGLVPGNQMEAAER